MTISAKELQLELNHFIMNYPEGEVRFALFRTANAVKKDNTSALRILKYEVSCLNDKGRFKIVLA